MSRNQFAKWIAGLMFSGCMMVPAVPAQADWNEFWHCVHVDYHRNNQWPHPFRGMDTAAVNSPFEVMKNNGWRAYNTISDPLFDPATNTLTVAGRRHVQWILTQAPQHRRVVFILKSDTQEKTAARLAEVQKVAAELTPGAPPAGVYVTDIVPNLSPGQYQNAISRALINSIPDPRLPAFGGLSNPNAGAASSGAASGGGTP
jgi:hypothetical protein